jgi:hypothetical protein
VTWMFEVYYLPPPDPAREERLADAVARYGGRLDFREAPEVDSSHNVCLTYEFASQFDADAAAGAVRAAGEHVEGPYPYT